MAENKYDLSNKFKTWYYRTIREIAIIRAISALEVLLIELVKEIFIHKNFLFHTGNKIEFSENELLSFNSISNIWSKIINKECRRLQNQGFSEIKKYYKKTFAIDFNNFVINPNDIEYIHTIRHLLVHRLGNTDKQFRLKYNTSLRCIQLTDNLFYEYLEKLELFGNQASDKAFEIIENNIDSKLINKFDTKCFLVIEIINNEMCNFLKPDFTFSSDENICILKEFLENYNRDNELVKLNLFADRRTISDYLRFIKVWEKEGDLRILDKKIIEFSKITQNEIDEVKKILPIEDPLPYNIHKKIAKELNIKQTKAYQIIEWIKNNKHK